MTGFSQDKSHFKCVSNDVADEKRPVDRALFKPAGMDSSLKRTMFVGSDPLLLKYDLALAAWCVCV